MLFPICVLLDVIEFVPFHSNKCCELIIPLLFNYVSYSDLSVTCVYGLGVCGMHGGGSFTSVLSKAVTLLLGLCGADPQAAIEIDGDVDNDSVKDNVYSSLFKIAIYRKNELLQTSEQLLKYCMSNMPITCDTNEAQELHRLFIDLLCVRDLRLLGQNGHLENLSEVLLILAQLASIDDENRNMNTLQNIDNNKKHDVEFWEKQIIFSKTLHTARSVIKKELGKNLKSR